MIIALVLLAGAVGVFLRFATRASGVERNFAEPVASVSPSPVTERLPGSSLPAGSRCVAGRQALGSRRSAYVASLGRPIKLYHRPGAAPFANVGRRHRSFAGSSKQRVPTVLPVLAELRGSDCRPLWYLVQEPGRRGALNGEVGYTRPAALEIYELPERITVSLSQRRLTLLENGRVAMRVSVAVGAPSTPTPTGLFFVEERIRIADSSGPDGVAALALSARSKVLVNWAQGGPIAIHGTNDPGSIGNAVSHGCVRLGRRDLERLFARVAIGTPVRIVR
jgi:hypothetical protein